MSSYLRCITPKHDVMKYVIFIAALLTLATSCELRSTNFDPDDQLVYEDELTQIASWDQFQAEHLSTREYESQYPEKYVDAEYTARQNSKGNWILEGSIKNFASETHITNAELVASFYDEANKLLGTENYTVQDYLTPGDLAGFYFKSDSYPTAISVQIKIDRVTPVE